MTAHENEEGINKAMNEHLAVDRAKEYFNCTDRERVAFEAGIKLGSVYHQFVGTPVSLDNVEVLEKAIEEGLRVQPFVEDVRIRIDRTGLRNKRHQYDYMSLTGNMLDVQIIIRYNDSVANCKIEYIKELNYPLMYITGIE